MAALTGVASGLYDLRTALARARFFDRAYIEIVLIKNGLGLVLTVGGALAFGSAKIALAGACLSVGVAMAATYRDLRDPEARLGLAERSLARTFFAYAAPFIVSSALFQLIPFAGRILAGALYGYDEAGQFSLANDIGMRVLAAIASAMDVDPVSAGGARGGNAGARGRARAIGRQHGAGRRRHSAGRRRALAVPAERRGADRARGLSRAVFRLSRRRSLPGLAAFALMMYAVAPIFQIAKRTAPMIVAALAASARRRRAVGGVPRGRGGVLARQRAERRASSSASPSRFSWPGRAAAMAARAATRRRAGRHRRDGAGAVAAARAGAERGAAGRSGGARRGVYGAARLDLSTSRGCAGA